MEIGTPSPLCNLVLVTLFLDWIECAPASWTLSYPQTKVPHLDHGLSNHYYPILVDIMPLSKVLYVFGLKIFGWTSLMNPEGSCTYNPRHIGQILFDSD